MENQDQANSSESKVASPPPIRKRIHWGWVAVWIGVVVLLIIVFMQLLKVQRPPAQIGREVPEFTLTTFDGDQISLDSLAGKVVLINFWASWCKPCEQEAADLEEAWKVYQSRDDVVFLGVDWTDTEKNGLAYLDRFGITYPNGQDLGTRISQKFRITGVPETYIVGKDGKLAYFKLSPFTSLQEITSVIDQLLQE